MLCSVTARTIMVVRWSWLFGPSACKLFWCRCGMRWSSSSKNRMPSQKPAAAGKNASLPRSAACSIAGISKLHTDAATITPAAKPVRVRWMPSRKAFFKKNTQPAPRLVWQAEQAHHANNEKQEVPTCWVFVKQFSRNDMATACQDWLRSTRLGRGSIKSHVRTVKVLGMGLFAFQERIHLWKGVTH